MASSKIPNSLKVLLLLLISSLSLVAFCKSHHQLLIKFPSAYQILKEFDLPGGILPEGVQSYLLRKDGTFDVYLDGKCEFKVADKYLVRYKRKISGMVEAGLVKDLDGVSVKVLFLWVGISKVERAGDEIRFYVGPIPAASFPASSLEESPRCTRRRGYVDF
ncbi:uncharacterized protein At5g01610-like [Typha latifolia]|uniref:uncharacterized protein At5g01610-like n=1 Tax=Typha latifolia TaxID=4733 RepID=UPI003C2C6A62